MHGKPLFHFKGRDEFRIAEERDGLVLRACCIHRISGHSPRLSEEFFFDTLIVAVSRPRCNMRIPIHIALSLQHLSILSELRFPFYWLMSIFL